MIRGLLLFLFIIQQFECNAQIIANYSDTSHWVLRPDIENNLFENYIQDSADIKYADVFYIYPTVFTDKKNKNWNISIDDAEQREKVKRVTKFQGSAWAEAGRMFVPYYTQANLRSYFALESGGRKALLKAYEDVKKAFVYYLENHNNGRPIIIAGHSQGSTHGMLGLKDFFDEKELQNQLICAYLPGIGLETDEFNSIRLSIDPEGTGGFVTWNTFKKKYKTKKYKTWYQGKAAVNPVTWNTEKFAGRSLHKGFLFWDDKIYENSFKTNLVDGAVWISLPHVPFRSIALTFDDYHIGDVNLFWKDIQVNAKMRINAFKKKN